MQIQERFFYDFPAKVPCETRTKGVGRGFPRFKQQNIRGRGIGIGAEETKLESQGRNGYFLVIQKWSIQQLSALKENPAIARR